MTGEKSVDPLEVAANEDPSPDAAPSAAFRKLGLVAVMMHCPACGGPLTSGTVHLGRLLTGEISEMYPWCETEGCRTALSVDVTPQGRLEIAVYDVPWDYVDRRGSSSPAEQLKSKRERNLRLLELKRLRRAWTGNRFVHYARRSRHLFATPAQGGRIDIGPSSHPGTPSVRYTPPEDVDWGAWSQDYAAFKATAKARGREVEERVAPEGGVAPEPTGDEVPPVSNTEPTPADSGIATRPGGDA